MERMLLPMPSSPQRCAVVSFHGGGKELAVEAYAAFRPQANGKAEASTRSYRPSGRTSTRTYSNREGSTRCLGSLRIAITGVHTAASAGLLPPPACKQRTTIPVGRKRRLRETPLHLQAHRAFVKGEFPGLLEPRAVPYLVRVIRLHALDGFRHGLAVHL